LHLVLIPLADY